MMGPKSSNFVHVNYPQSMDTLIALLEVLKDPKLYEKQLSALKDYIDKANKTIETLGKAEEIEHLLANAKVKQTQADQAAHSIQEKIDTLLNDAHTNAHKIVNDAQFKANQLLETAKTAAEQAKTDQEQAKADKEKYESLLKSVENRESDISRREQAVKDLEAEVARKKALLSQL